jgi:hypothetical protein
VIFKSTTRFRSGIHFSFVREQFTQSTRNFSTHPYEANVIEKDYYLQRAQRETKKLQEHLRGNTFYGKLVNHIEQVCFQSLIKPMEFIKLTKFLSKNEASIQHQLEKSNMLKLIEKQD